MEPKKKKTSRKGIKEKEYNTLQIYFGWKKN